MKNIKMRLTVMNFLQFAIWGAYLTCIGNYLGSVGMGDLIPWFLLDSGYCLHIHARSDGNFGR